MTNQSDPISETMPALFIGHGSPTNTLESNRWTQSWADLGRRLPRPRAILAISAHWYFGATAVTAMEQPRTIHDFYGFGRELFEFEYPAPGLPDLAGEIIEMVKPEWIGADRDQWGLDHGTWSVLAHMYPQADVPVLQLSINALRPLDYHISLGQKLAELRNRGVLVIGSGNVVHNLGALDRHSHDGTPWARRFDEAATQLMEERPHDVLSLRDHPDYAMAVPTPDHFIPLLYLAGMASGAEQPISSFNHGCTLGSISMTSHALGAPCPDAGSGGQADDAVPAGIPPEQTNI